MAELAKFKLHLRSFKKWALSSSLSHPRTKLPLRWAVKIHEDVVDFVHGSIIGLLLGFVVGLAIKGLLS